MSFDPAIELQTLIVNERVRAAVVLSSMGALALFLLYILSRRISVNEFSLHLFYRNRLARTFLGASNLKRETKSNRFTGFALDDNLPLGSLQQGNFDGPCPIWGTALNLTSGEDLAWQKRKATSFIYSPLFCGWDYFSPGRVLASGLRDLGYRAVAACTQDGEGNGKGYGGKFGAPFIGTAMAASGAAISPNWVITPSLPLQHSSPFLTFGLAGGAFPNPNESCISVSGVTSTVIATRELDPAGEHIYRAFGENIAFEQERFLQSLALTGDDLSRVGVLYEAEEPLGFVGGLAQMHRNAILSRITNISLVLLLAGDPVKPQLSNLLQRSAVSTPLIGSITVPS